MKFIGIIPARYASTRFPGKPLAMINGKSMIQRVYQQAEKCSDLHEVVVATDHHEIFEHVSKFGNVVMTSAHHPSGTDRCLEAFSIINKNNQYPDNSIIVNIQGDEPFIEPGQISLLLKAFNNPQTTIATLVKKILSSHELFNENVVKAVINNNNQAMYFSRLPIPFFRNTHRDQWVQQAAYYKHIGLYAFTCITLEKICTLPQGVYEKAESLEQLRWLENGFNITAMITEHQGIAIDTPEDLKNIENQNCNLKGKEKNKKA